MANIKQTAAKGLLAFALLAGGFAAGNFLPVAGADQTVQQGAGVKAESRLDEVIARGYIRVGTAGDYKPFTYLNPKTGEYEGYDIDAAKQLAEALGVEVRFVKTSWPTLMDDLLADKFDIAMGGISRNYQRQIAAHLSQAYYLDGKTALINEKNKDKFKSLADIDQPGVTIAVNPGGTNEKFVRANIKQAKITVIENNMDIPGLIAEGKYDVMFTDGVEAKYYAKQDKRLYAAFTDHPFTHDDKAYLMQRGDAIFQNFVNFWVEEMKAKGGFAALEKKWLQ
jgi:cyclohexadienyl dehydratase